MARPEEKARSMLNKWVKMKEQMGDEGQTILDRGRHGTIRRRPYLASLCNHLYDAEQYRKEIIHEISRKITKIQNPGLGEHATRDLNDEINKLFREKYHWNKRIKELGGTDYNRIERIESSSETSKSGSSGDGLIVGSGGYRYFGAAKDLPGVREMFAQQAVKSSKRKRGDIYKYINPDYYGLVEEEDGVLLHVEEKASVKRREMLIRLREDQKISRLKLQEHDEHEAEKYLSDDEDLYTDWIGGNVPEHVCVPTQEYVSRVLLEQKKKELLASLHL